jgi:hypothetical protein
MFGNVLRAALFSNLGRCMLGIDFSIDIEIIKWSKVGLDALYA